MLMRFHWGLAVGHVYTHKQPCTNTSMTWINTNQPEHVGEGGLGPEGPTDTVESPDTGFGTDGSDSDSDDEDYEPSEGDSDRPDDDASDDEHFIDMDEMYGLLDSDDGLSEG